MHLHLLHHFIIINTEEEEHFPLPLLLTTINIVNTTTLSLEVPPSIENMIANANQCLNMMRLVLFVSVFSMPEEPSQSKIS